MEAAAGAEMRQAELWCHDGLAANPTSPWLQLRGALQGPFRTTCLLKTLPPNPPELVAASWPEALDFMSSIKALHAL